MKVRELRTVVDRTSSDLANRLPAMKRQIEGKTPLQLNTTERMVMRTRQLSESALRPSKSEQERILGENDLVDLNFFERGLIASKAVCRVILRNDARRQIGVASGFMVSAKLLLTNNHVFPNAAEASRALAQFDYVLDINGVERRGPSFRLRPDLFFHTDPGLDFALTAVDDAPESDEGGTSRLSDFGALRLNPQLGKINEGEFISIIQHPSGLPKQAAIRENKLLSIDELFLVYASDTAQGSSGSPLFNDSWQVVGLHSAGVPNMRDGRWLTKSGAAADDDTDDGDIDWIGNRGARASRIVAAVSRLSSHPLLDDFLRNSVGEGLRYPRPELIASAARPDGTSRITGLKVLAEDGGARIELPAGFTAEIQQVRVAAAPAPTTAIAAPAPIPVEAYKSPYVDPKYSNRRGYDETFLSVAVPMPGVVKKSLAAPMRNGDVAIPYEHFSVIMHKQRRLALLTACNVDGREKARRPDPSKSYTRAALGEMNKGDIEMWVEEKRIDPAHQLPDRFFKNDRKSFDKGHIVRRDDVVWGRTYAQVKRANGDTFHVTNCSPQIAAFNQSSKGGEWGKLENMILKQTKNEKIVIFAGPVFDDDKDKPFKGEDADGEELIVKIPSRFWKIVVADGDEGLESFGFLLKQDLRSVVWEFDVTDEWIERMTPLEEIQDVAKLVKIPKLVMDADMFEYVGEHESLGEFETLKFPAEAAAR